MDAEMDHFFASSQIAMGLGDVDGDGFADFATSAFDASFTHYVHLRYGGPRPSDLEGGFALAESGARLIVRPTPEAAILESISPLGDVDGDGFADFLVGWGPCTPASAGSVYIVYGGAERLDGVRSLEDVGVHLQGPIEAKYFTEGCTGASGLRYFVGLGDFDGDGFDDFILSDRQTGQIGESAGSVAYLFYGRAERITAGTAWGDADAQLTALHDLVVVALRDVNGDGLADVVIGGSSPGAREPAMHFWLPGRAERLSGLLDLAAVGTPIHEASAAGDLDADGIHEVLLLDLEWRPHLFYGAPGLFDAGADLSQAAATFDAYLAQLDAVPHSSLRVTTAGDRDGDGDDELAASVFTDLRHPSAFDVALISGSRQRLSGSVAFHEQGQPFEDRAALLEGLVSVGDLDGDGATELVSLSSRYEQLDNDSALSFGNRSNIHYGTPGGHSVPPPR